MSEIPDLPPILERLLGAGYHEQIGAYALDSLPPDERVAFETHLRDCIQCQAELPILREAATVLRRAIVPEQAPAPSPTTTTSPPAAEPTPEFDGIESEAIAVEESLEVEAPRDHSADDEIADIEDVAAIEEPATGTTQEPIEEIAPELIEAEPAPAAVKPSEPTAAELLADLPPIDESLLTGDVAATTEETVAAPRGKQSRSRSRTSSAAAAQRQQPAATSSKLPWILAGLGLLFGIGSIIAALALAETKGNLEEEIAFQNAQIDELNAQRDAYLQQTTAITWTLEPTTLGTPGSGGIVFADPAGTSTILSVYGMAPLGADQMYQIWYVLPDDTSVPGPALAIDASGNGLATLQPDLSAYKAVAITVEPAGGSELPSTNPVLQGFFTTS